MRSNSERGKPTTAVGGKHESGTRGPKGSRGHAWSQLEDESFKAYAAFTEYLKLGARRSLRQAATAIGGSLPLVKRWSARHDWLARAGAWDENQVEKATGDLAGDFRDDLSRQMTENKLLRGHALKRIIDHLRGHSESNGGARKNRTSIAALVSIYRAAQAANTQVDALLNRHVSADVTEERLQQLTAPELDRLESGLRDKLKRIGMFRKGTSGSEILDTLDQAIEKLKTLEPEQLRELGSIKDPPDLRKEFESPCDTTNTLESD